MYVFSYRLSWWVMPKHNQAFRSHSWRNHQEWKHSFLLNVLYSVAICCTVARTQWRAVSCRCDIIRLDKHNDEGYDFLPCISDTIDWRSSLTIDLQLIPNQLIFDKEMGFQGWRVVNWVEMEEFGVFFSLIFKPHHRNLFHPTWALCHTTWQRLSKYHVMY